VSAVWRQGRKVPLNIYEDFPGGEPGGEPFSRPVCQCHTAADANLICHAVNRLIAAEEEQVQNEMRERRARR